MPLTLGSRLGPYEIVAPLGAGGMGEVYRARDSRLDRDVAIKVLPEHLSMNVDMRARFEREAKAVSSLNHPNICTLFDIGHQDGVDYLVMELLEGETLAVRLTRGALPTADTLRVATQIADALDRAHKQGLVHRDLKPGNVMLTKSGAKLLDFGLARVTGLAGPARGSGVTMAALTQSPTMASPLTAEGSIVGTFQYMSPEQLEGHEADARSDLFAFGAMLYEMITGKRAFEAKSQASLIAAILDRDPAPVSSISPLAPPALDRVVKQCLAKDPDQRYQSAHDLKLQLEWIAEGASQAGVSAPVAARRRFSQRMLGFIAGAVVAAMTAFAVGYLGRTPPPRDPVQFLVESPRELAAVDAPRLSPDGRLLAFNATDTTGVTRIWLRPIGSLQAYPLAGTEGATRPFWSPDSRELAFFSAKTLKRVPAAGGAVQAVCECNGADGTWGSRGWIVFDSGTADSLLKVRADGGVPAPAVAMDRAAGDVGQAWPWFLPDGRHFLFVCQTARLIANVVAIGDIETGKVVRLYPSGSRVEFGPPNYVYTQRGGTLIAQRMDLKSFKLIGDPFPVVDGLGGVSNGNAYFSTSPAGLIAYRQGGVGASGSMRLRWFDRSGRPLSDIGPTADITNVRLSPDGRRVATSEIETASGTENIWVRDLERGVSSRLTFEPTDETWPTWTPDGQRVTYTSNRSGFFETRDIDATGTGQSDSLFAQQGIHLAPSDWSRDGRTMLVAGYGAQQWDVFTWQHGDGKLRPFLETTFSEGRARFSPDGHWVAYRSNESGRFEIYVRPFPGPGGKWQISTNGGSQPRWRADGKELFYQGLKGEIVAVPVSGGQSFEIGAPKPLFALPLVTLGYGESQFDVSADGQRFIAIVPSGINSTPPIVVLMNWRAQIKR